MKKYGGIFVVEKDGIYVYREHSLDSYAYLEAKNKFAYC